MAKKKQDQDQGKETRRGHGEGSWQYLDELDKWKFRVSAKDPDGVTRRFSVTATTKGECRELAKARAEQIEKGIGLNIDTKNITVAEYLTRWLQDYVVPSKSVSTQKAYRAIIKSCLAGQIGGTQLRNLQRPALQRHFNELAKSGKSTATISLAQKVLHSSLKQAFEDRIIGLNPASGLRLAPVVNKERMAYSAQEVKEILRLAGNHPFRLGFYLLFFLGLRGGEMLGLRGKHIDLQKGEIQIVEQLNRNGPEVYGPLKTKSSKRTLPISPELAAEIKAGRIRQKEELLKAGIAWTEELPVLSDAIGQPIRHAVFRDEYYGIVSSAGLQSTGTHDARHTCFTILAANGMDTKTLSRFAGHANVAFTLNVYCKPSAANALAGVKALDGLLCSAK